MGQGYVSKKVLGPWEGVDYRPNNLERSDVSASDMRNAHITPDNLITQRPGTTRSGIRISAGGSNYFRVGHGIGSAFLSQLGFAAQGGLDDSLTPSIFVMDANTNPMKVFYTVPVTVGITLTNSGAAKNFTLKAAGVGQNYFLTFYDSSNNVLSTFDCGLGTENIPTMSLTAFGALLTSKGFSYIQTGNSAALAACPVQALGPIDTFAYSLPPSLGFYRQFMIWNPTPLISAVQSGTSLGVGAFNLAQNLGFSSAVSHGGNTTYFTYNGNIFQNDGVRGYTPGAPHWPSAAFSFNTATAGNVDIGTRTYAFQLRYYDANGGFVDGPLITNSGTNFSDPTKGYTCSVAGATRQVKITYAALASAVSGIQLPTMYFPTANSSATVTTSLTGMTGHSFVVGDQVIVPAYHAAGTFLDPVDTVNVGRVASLPDADTLNIDGIGFNFNPGAVARNLSLIVWRIKLGGTEFSFVGETPLNAAGTTVIDNTADSNLGAAYVLPDYVPGAASLARQGSPNFGNPLPAFKFLAIHDNLLCAAGGDTVFYSLPDMLSNWAADQNSFTIPCVAGEQITGIKSVGGLLYIWTNTSTYQVSGALPQPGIADTSFSLVTVSTSVGCVSHKSITVVEERVVWLDNSGLYSITPGGYPTPIDVPLRPLYTGNVHGVVGNTFTAVGQFDIGHASYDPNKKLFMCSFFQQTPDLASSTIVLVWNIGNGGLWEVWDGGPQDALSSTQGNIFVPGYGTYLIGENSAFVPPQGNLTRFSDQEPALPAKYQAADNSYPIPFAYSGSWEEMAAPSISKNFTRFRVLGGITETTEQAFTVDTTLQRNYSTALAGFKTLDFNSTSGFGLGGYGITPYGDPSKDGLNMKLLNTKARSLRPVFTHNKLYEKIKIAGWEYEVSGDFKQNKNR